MTRIIISVLGWLWSLRSLIYVDSNMRWSMIFLEKFQYIDLKASDKVDIYRCDEWFFTLDNMWL